MITTELLEQSSHGFVVPKLKFAHDALEPVMSADTVHYHYDKHTKGYYDKTNELIKGTRYARVDSLKDLLSRDSMMEVSGTLFNQAAQAWNHSFWWEQLTPEKTQLSPKLAAHIEEQFKSLEDFKSKFEELGTKQFGSGWAWLVLRDEQLRVTTTPNAGTPLTMKGETPLMVVDLWEHSYYLTYHNDRAKYLHNMWKIIDWDVVSERLDAAS